MNRFFMLCLSSVLLGGCIGMGSDEAVPDDASDVEVQFLYEFFDVNGELSGYRDTLGYHFEDQDVLIPWELFVGLDEMQVETVVGGGVLRSALEDFVGCVDGGDETGSSSVCRYVNSDGEWVTESRVETGDDSTSYSDVVIETAHDDGSVTVEKESSTSVRL